MDSDGTCSGLTRCLAGVRHLVVGPCIRGIVLLVSRYPACIAEIVVFVLDTQGLVPGYC